MRALLLVLALLLTPATALGQSSEARLRAMTEAEAAEARAATNERLAREQLREARSAFERGGFDRAIQLFEGILGTPVALRTPDDLHDAFLHYAFTLFLIGDKVTAANEARTALQLKPDFVPSPVTTRPDVRDFYDEQRAIFLGEGGKQALPGELFPELAGSRFIKTRSELPVPLFGIRLRQLGRRGVGNGFLALEAGGLALNAVSWVIYALQYPDLRQSAKDLPIVVGVANWTSFPLIIVAFTAELIVTGVLDRRARLGREPDAFWLDPAHDALRLEARSLAARRRAPPRIRAGGAGLGLSTW